MSEDKNLSSTEFIKRQSNGLRGTIEAELDNQLKGSISETDQALIKFHGMYQQDDRDRREERAEKKLDRLYSFMIRLRLPGGFLTSAQWIATHHIAGAHSTGVIKVTTRQTIQLHGLLKSRIKPTIQSFNTAGLDSIATCGDINRNVSCSSHPGQSEVHEAVFAYADQISTLLKPKTRAYYEIWLGDEKISERTEEDPLYEDRYLPRKFKIGIAIPPNNDVDVFTNDLGLIAIIEDGKLQGFNIAIGGGMGTTHGNKETYPRLGSVIGFTEAGEKTLKAIYEVLTVQRDYGNRSDRKLSRLKYTIDKYGIEWFRDELEKRTGFSLEPARAFRFTAREDYYGWKQNHKHDWHYTLFLENGRILDTDELPLKKALFEVAETGLANFRFTSSQNLILSDIGEEGKDRINQILEKYGLTAHTGAASAVRKNAMACVALNTCPLALAEGQRYMPLLVDKIEVLLRKHQIENEQIIMRMTGCPNGCARPYAAEVGFIGTGPGRYNMYLGGDRYGERLNRVYKENLDESSILEELDQWFGSFRSDRSPGEHFGDYTHRKMTLHV